ncbi:hypothetical protein [Bifidobacterium platyrrhinorum]|uniref:Helix-turn-helix domain-containing protein n=1 Tax=Bifidobacterium platyrrhinorum TaxID=2661628 RepID=A0A6L9SW37_9BIFI|nr:hypothetical protein [Bifidobacterium platyrrhinorum]NEG55401.1 hypothetical protein [Bifidobacterium platyrrhinorum]
MKTSKQIASGIVAELARQGHSKGDLADVWGVTKQSVYTKLRKGDLTTDDVDKAASFLNIPFVALVASALNAPVNLAKEERRLNSQRAAPVARAA